MPSRAAHRLEKTVARQVAQDGSRNWLIAFSGGPDSTALAWAFSRLDERFRVALAHIDHGLDSGSGERARQAEEIARGLGMTFILQRLEDGASRPGGLSLEAWARERRYGALRTIARRTFDGARIATAHHADDQAETLLLRLAFGTRLRGLAGIRPRFGPLVRPLLDMRRAELLDALEEIGLSAVTDPTNRDLARPRNRIRHEILPEWTSERPALVPELGQLARTAARASVRLDEFFARRLRMETLPGGGASLDRRGFESLPPVMQPFALTTLEISASKALPSPTSARSELFRQLGVGARVGCDAGAGWRWQADGRSLRLLPPRKPLARFTYTVQVPGSVSIAEIGTSLRISAASAKRLEVADQAEKAFLRPPSTACHRVEIRNRRPGDRLRPAGRQSERRLKALLIDQRIPREQRDHIPLVVVDGRIAWVPGVAVDERFHVREGESAWLVELDKRAASVTPMDDPGDLTEDMR